MPLSCKPSHKSLYLKNSIFAVSNRSKRVKCMLLWLHKVASSSIKVTVHDSCVLYMEVGGACCTPDAPHGFVWSNKTITWLVRWTVTLIILSGFTAWRDIIWPYRILTASPWPVWLIMHGKVDTTWVFILYLLCLSHFVWMPYRHWFITDNLWQIDRESAGDWAWRGQGELFYMLWAELGKARVPPRPINLLLLGFSESVVKPIIDYRFTYLHHSTIP